MICSLEVESQRRQNLSAADGLAAEDRERAETAARCPGYLLSHDSTLLDMSHFPASASSSMLTYFVRCSAGIFSRSIALSALTCRPSIRFLMRSQLLLRYDKKFCTISAIIAIFFISIYSLYYHDYSPHAMIVVFSMAIDLSQPRYQKSCSLIAFQEAG